MYSFLFLINGLTFSLTLSLFSVTILCSLSHFYSNFEILIFIFCKRLANGFKGGVGKAKYFVFNELPDNICQFSVILALTFCP